MTLSHSTYLDVPRDEQPTPQLTQIPLLYDTQPIHTLNQPLIWIEKALYGHATLFLMN